LITPVYSQQIITDGKTNTTLNVSGNVTNVDTATIKGKNAFNSFSKFNVDTGNVVNLKVPGASENLINFIYSEQSHINGKLNAIKNSSIGGNIFLVNPHGVVISSTGEINVGSLNVVTPTTSYMNGFFDSPNNVNDASIQALLDGTVPINPNAVINVEGKINAITNVKMDAGSVYNTGDIYSGAQFDEKNITIGDVVNINTLENGAELAKNSGEIIIKTAGDFINEGNIIADGGNNIDAGNITITPGQDAVLKEGSIISAKGKGENSNGGSAIVFANRDSFLEEDAVISTMGGNISGDGGFVELSANRNVSIAGELNAYAKNGFHGSILIDPTWVDGVIYFASDYYSHGADLTINGSSSIDIQSVISTRVIAGVDSQATHAADPSTGNSGNLTLNAPNIYFRNGSSIYTFTDGIYTGGTLESNSTNTYSYTGAEIHSNDLTLNTSNYLSI
jgi:filamentous hemagglutinin family protein